jgi:hypothetical protein
VVGALVRQVVVATPPIAQDHPHQQAPHQRGHDDRGDEEALPQRIDRLGLLGARVGRAEAGQVASGGGERDGD